jgi:hypothetical protein
MPPTVVVRSLNVMARVSLALNVAVPLGTVSVPSGVVQWVALLKLPASPSTG